MSFDLIVAIIAEYNRSIAVQRCLCRCLRAEEPPSDRTANASFIGEALNLVMKAIHSIVARNYSVLTSWTSGLLVTACSWEEKLPSSEKEGRMRLGPRSSHRGFSARTMC